MPLEAVVVAAVAPQPEAAEGAGARVQVAAEVVAALMLAAKRKRVVVPGKARRLTTAGPTRVPTSGTPVSTTSTSKRQRHCVNGCCGGGWDNDYHPVATAAAVGAAVAVTSAVVGSMVATVPPSCVPVNYGGMVYQQCGSTWYQPQGAQYVVINPPY
jgi:hypothetical protein